MSRDTERAEDTRMLFDLRSTDGLDYFAKIVAAFQQQGVRFTATKDGQWAAIEVE